MKKLMLLLALAIALSLTVVGCAKKPSGESGGSASDAELQAFLGDHVYFDYDRYAIRSDQVPVLQSKVAYLNANSSATAEIQGHCDERGSEAYNLALGDRRAKAAYNYVVDAGISSSRLSTISYGEERPLDPGHDESAWSKNRRAQFAQ
ncbi:MAG: peptidoglycan-associated lipoprotein Pal [Deltaproteobacteria bacterium]|nr:peptidoglycan-associated lipoprotein Pal [Deltaproteobacteria bacterium]